VRPKIGRSGLCVSSKPYVRLKSLPAGRCFVTGPEPCEPTEAAAAAAWQAAESQQSMKVWALR
jgi:hypothetical protein